MKPKKQQAKGNSDEKCSQSMEILFRSKQMINSQMNLKGDKLREKELSDLVNRKVAPKT